MICCIYVIESNQIQKAERELFLLLDIGETESENQMGAVWPVFQVVIVFVLAVRIYSAK